LNPLYQSCVTFRQLSVWGGRGVTIRFSSVLCTGCDFKEHIRLRFNQSECCIWQTGRIEAFKLLIISWLWLVSVPDSKQPLQLTPTP